MQLKRSSKANVRLAVWSSFFFEQVLQEGWRRVSFTGSQERPAIYSSVTFLPTYRKPTLTAKSLCVTTKSFCSMLWPTNLVNKSQRWGGGDERDTKDMLWGALILGPERKGEIKSSLPEGKHLNRWVVWDSDEGRDGFPLYDGCGWNHDLEIIIQSVFREWWRSGVLVEPHATNSPQGRGRVRAKLPLLAWADGAVLSGLLRVALCCLCGLQHVVELDRCALGHIEIPLTPWHDAGRAEPAGQWLQLGHTKPQFTLQLAASAHLLGLVESKHVHTGQLVDGAVVVPVPSGDVKQYLDPGFSQVNPGVDDKGLHLPVVRKKRGRGESPWTLEQI